jgi:hypothetical protein
MYEWLKYTDSVVVLAQMKTNNVRNNVRWIVTFKRIMSLSVFYEVESWDGKHKAVIGFYCDLDGRLFIEVDDESVATSATQYYQASQIQDNQGALANAIANTVFSK